jgi:hypothetical protein
MNRHTDPLSRVKIASPCSADWEQMLGDGRRRFCAECELNVYNLSGMTKREAEELLNQTEGRLCVRFYRRADGTILTQDCPVGWRALRRRLSRITTAALSTVLGFLSGLGLYTGLNETMLLTLMGELPVHESPIMGSNVSYREGIAVGQIAVQQGNMSISRKIPDVRGERISRSRKHRR